MILILGEIHQPALSRQEAVDKNSPHLLTEHGVLLNMLSGVFWPYFSDETSFFKVSKLLPVICPEESLVHSSAQIVSKHMVSAGLGRAGMGHFLGTLRLVLEKLVWGCQALDIVGLREVPNWVLVIKSYLPVQALKQTAWTGAEPSHTNPIRKVHYSLWTQTLDLSICVPLPTLT